jgi:type IV secretory pathway TrbD component
MVFPHPGANDALELSALGPLLYVVTLGASFVAVVGVAVLNWKAEGAVGLGVFFLGVATAFVSAILTFGNFSNDRFAPLFLTPLLAVPVGVALVVSGLMLRSGRRGNLLLGALRGAACAAIVGVWLLARGAADWLQAPYGFDVYVLITVAAAAVLYLGADPSRQKRAAQTSSQRAHLFAAHG